MPESRQPERAIENWKSILREEPTNDWARGELKRLYRQSGRWNALVELLKQEAAEVREAAASEKVALLQHLIDISRDHLAADPLVLALYYRAILDLEPRNAGAILALLDIYEGAKRWGDVVDLLISRAGSIGEPAEKIALLDRAATLLIDRLGNFKRAADVLEEIRRLDPENARTVEILKEVYRRKRDWSALFRILEREVVGLNGEEKKERLVEMARLCADQLADHARADDLWRQVLEIDPLSTEAITAREQIAERQGNWASLCDLIEARISLTDDEGKRLALLGRVGTVCSEHLGDGARAARAWRRILEIRPGSPKALRSFKNACIAAGDWIALERLHVESGDFKGLVETFSSEAEENDDPDTKTKLLLRCAEICVDPLKRPDDAVPFYERVLATDPQNVRSARALLPIYRRREQWDRVVGVLVVLLDRSGKLEIEGEDTVALTALEGAAERAGQWQVLIQALERHRARTDEGSKEWRSLTLRIVPILIDEPTARDRVVALLDEVLARFPGDKQAISYLEPLLDDRDWRLTVARILYPNLSRSAKWELEATVLSLVIESSLVADECLVLQKRLADVLLKKARDPVAAFDVLTAALREHAADRELWDRMTDVAATIGSYDALTQRLADVCNSWQLDEALKAELASRLAQVLETQARFGDATEFHLKVLQINPENVASLQALERYYGTAERWDDLLGLYDEILLRDICDATRLDIHIRLCVVVDEILHRVPDAIAAYAAVLEFDPGNERAVRALAALFEEAGRWQDLYDLLCGQVEATRAGESLATCSHLGEIAERRLDRPAIALEWYERVLSADPGRTQAREGVERLLDRETTRYGAARLLESIYTRQGADVPCERVMTVELENEQLPASEREAVLLRLSILREQRLGDLDGAFAALSEAFVLNPANRRIQEEAARVAAVLGDVERYARLVDRAADSMPDDVRVAGRLMRESARLYDEQIGDEARAASVYRRLLRIGAADVSVILPALSALERIFSKRDSWPEVMQVLRAKADVQEEPDAQKEVLHMMARIEESKIGRVQEAIVILKEILKIDRTDARALAGLERLFERAGMWIELIDVLRQRSAMEVAPAARQALLRRIASIASQLSVAHSRR